MKNVVKLFDDNDPRISALMIELDKKVYEMCTKNPMPLATVIGAIELLKIQIMENERGK